MKIIYALILVTLCGCATPYKPTENAPTPDTRVVKIQTDPPGMRIFFGIAGNEDRATQQREYVGESPCSLTVKCDEQGRFRNTISGLARPKAVFEAEPPHDKTNLFAQRQTFTVPAMFIRAPAIPSAVFFDMQKPSP